MIPQPGPAKLRQQRISREDWNQHRDVIQKLWIDQNLSLKRVKRELGFYFTKRQFDRAVKRWGMRKNVRKKEMQYIAHEKRQRDIKGKKSAITINGNKLRVRKLSRWERRYKDKPELSMSDANPISPLEHIAFSPENPEEPERSRYHYRYGNPNIWDSPQLTRLEQLLKEDWSLECEEDIPPIDLETHLLEDSREPCSEVESVGPAELDTSVAVLRTSSYRRVAPELAFHNGVSPSMILEVSPFPYTASKRQMRTWQTSYEHPYKRKEELRLKFCLSRLKQQNYAEDSPEFLARCVQLGQVYKAQGNYVTARPILDHVFKTKTKLLGPEHEETLFAGANLAEVLIFGGWYQIAETLVRRLQGVAKQVLDFYSDTTILLRSLQREITWEYGTFEDDICSVREVFQLALQKYGLAHPLSIRAYVYFAVKDQNFVARGLFSTALSITRYLGDDFEESAIHALYGFGIARIQQGQKEEGFALLEECVQKSRMVYGSDNPQTIYYQNVMSEKLLSAGKLAALEQVSSLALAEQRRIMGLDIEAALRVMSISAKVLIASGRYEESEQLFLQVIKERERLSGNNAFETVQVVIELGNQYLDQKRFDEAVSLYTEKYQKSKDGRVDTRNGLFLLCGLAVALYRAEQYDEAATRFLEVIKQWESFLKPDDYSLLRSYKGLIACYCKAGRIDDALNFLGAKVDLLESRRVEEGQIYSCIFSVAKFCYYEDLIELATALFTYAISRLERPQNSDQANKNFTNSRFEGMVAAYGGLLRCFFKAERFDDAFDFFTAKVELLESLQIEETGLCVWLSDIGYVFFRAEQHETASSIMRNVISRLEKVVGPMHASTFEAKVRYGWCLEAMGRFEEALVVYEEAYSGFEALQNAGESVDEKLLAQVKEDIPLMREKLEGAGGSETSDVQNDDIDDEDDSLNEDGSSDSEIEWGNYVEFDEVDPLMPVEELVF